MSLPAPLLSVRLSVDYQTKPGVLRDAAFEVHGGEVLGLVGESGSGKSTIALAILRLLSLKGGVARGEIAFAGRDLMSLSEGKMREVRGREIGLVLQSPLSSLNPSLRIGTQLTEAWKAHAGGSAAARTRTLAELLESVCLPTETAFLRRYPSQLSVGQAQRVLIAMAIVHKPSFLLADEPTSALDIITQAEILQLFAQLNCKLGMSILYISHDLLSVATLCHRIAILHEGRIVECAKTTKIFHQPIHPYTQELVRALPALPSQTPEGTLHFSPVAG